MSSFIDVATRSVLSIHTDKTTACPSVFWLPSADVNRRHFFEIHIIVIFSRFPDGPAADSSDGAVAQRPSIASRSRDRGFTADRNRVDSLEPNDVVVEKTSRHVAFSEKMRRYSF